MNSTQHTPTDRAARLSTMVAAEPEFVWVRRPADVPTDGLIGREIALARIGPSVIATFYSGDGSEREHPLQARTDNDDDILRGLVTETSDVVAFINDLDPSDPNRRWVQIGAAAVDGVSAWPSIQIGVDEAAFGSARRIAGSSQVKSNAAALRWLHGKFVLPGAPGRGEGGRLCAVPAPGQDLTNPDGCRLRGDGVMATLKKVGGGWRLAQVHRHSLSDKGVERTVLVHVDINFFNATVKTQLREQMREELDRLRTDEGERSFLAMWQRYHELDNRHALRRMVELKYLEYAHWRFLDDAEGVIRFELTATETELLGRLQDAVKYEEQIELECATELPEALGGARTIEVTVDGTAAGLLELELQSGNEVGIVTHVDVEARTVDMRMIQRRKSIPGGSKDRPTNPPPHGFLHAAVGGDHRRLQRRAQALRRLLAGDIPLPQLLSLLQGIPARGREKAREAAPLSEAASACFKKPPNPAQQLALKTALNTPDVAVIQGPPGTGKTQLIAALQVRLAEEQRAYAVVSRSMLLTSYQHAAVDNLVERSKVWNLPSVKIDSQNRGSTAHIDAWRTDTIAALKRDVPQTLNGRRALAMREVARQTAAYCAAPIPSEELAPLLGRIAQLVTGLVSDDLRDRLERTEMTLRDAVRVAALQVDHRRESALRAVRGIRCEPIPFDDDGPQMAAAALEYLRRLDAADERHLELLERAADWTAEDSPDFLTALANARDEILDRLTATADRLVQPTAREDVVDLLNAAIEDLDSRRRTSVEGIDLALLEYLEDLEGDPEAVLATLRLYTTSLATTCQQADSRNVRDAKDGERLFDTVIVDEAARANPLDLLIPLTLADKRIILVGDQNQLPHMLEPDVEQELRIDESNALSMLRESLFGRLFTLLHQGDDTPGRRRAVRLDEQYRMHPVLGDFVGRNFYQGNLKSPRPDREFSHGLDGYDDLPAAWLQVPQTLGREHGGRSKSRPVEARAIAQELRRHILNRPDLTFGVISFYSAQVKLIWKELYEAGLAELSGSGYRPVEALKYDHRGAEKQRLQVGTVDAFQGKEFDIAILSVTRSRPIPQFQPGQTDPAHPAYPAYERWARSTYGHLLLRNRLCVAMSRQQRLLVVVGDDSLFTTATAPPGVAPLTDFRRLCAPPSGVVLAGLGPVGAVGGIRGTATGGTS